MPTPSTVPRSRAGRSPTTASGRGRAARSPAGVRASGGRIVSMPSRQPEPGTGVALSAQRIGDADRDAAGPGPCHRTRQQGGHRPELYAVRDDQRLRHCRADPEPREASRAIGNDDGQDRLALHPCLREQPVDRRQQRRRVLPGAFHFLVDRAGATSSPAPPTAGWSRCRSRGASADLDAAHGGIGQVRRAGRAMSPPAPILRPVPATQ